MPGNQVIFLRVTNNQIKLSRVTSLIQEHFLKGDKITVHVPNEQAAFFVDDLLWKFHPEGFLPHKVVNDENNDHIAITITPQNVNQAKVCLNLRSEPLECWQEYEVVYELLDETQEKTLKQSRNKATTYKSLGLSIS